MKHVALLGDSILDNAAYVGGGPDVRAQLQGLLTEWKVTLLAVDGSTTQDIHTQLTQLPPDTSHIVISSGGNDALDHMGFLQEGADSVVDVLYKLSMIGERFQYIYHSMLSKLLSHGIPTAVCTIYYPRFPDPLLQRTSVTALTVFNDCIIREAFTAQIPLLDLRLICNQDTDYANPIEPSVAGGAKIAKAITKLLHEHDFNSPRTQIFI
ncbi:MAG TPA: SGNH/GDSL hydrolase family protein [Thermodesulfobacteriota bacterium]|nr:SGNH/GDSL hydrolase family protein [Thermodesulfobacteriota bacterium]